MTAVYGQNCTVYSPFFQKMSSHLRPKHPFAHLEMTFLIQKITKQDKETIVKRVKEVPESDETVCRETELVRGYEAQDRVVPESFPHLRSFPKISRGCGRSDEDVTKISPPEQCPDSDGLHFHQVSRTFHHRQSPNQAPVKI